jgi:hypothetical protein
LEKYLGGAMVRLFIAVLIVTFPVNAWAALSCCVETQPSAQVEKPCHDTQDTQKDTDHNCKNCAFCVMASFFLPESNQQRLKILSSEKQGYIQFLIDDIFHLPFKPPKSV